MSAHFKWYPASEEVVVPWNARYSFPSQANKCVKITPRIPPKNGAVFQPGQVIRVEFPAQGYINPINTTFEFDVTLTGWGPTATVPWNGGFGEITYFQNNIQSIFNRVRLLYGATPLEDIINYNMIVRSLTEWTSTNQTSSMDQTSISEGIGGCIIGLDAGVNSGYLNVRASYIQGIVNAQSGYTGVTGNFFGGDGTNCTPNTYVPNGAQNNDPITPLGGACTRRYQVNLALGLLTQDKLLPVKFMASQLAIEFTLEQPQNCIITDRMGGVVIAGVPTAAPMTASPTYTVTNFNIIPEILEFDASYDAMFLKGLQDGGVPIKFSSWHTFIFSSSNAANCNLLVQERSRSVKALFAMMRRGVPTYGADSHATFFDCSEYALGRYATMQNYQWRIGGRYFPAQPVQLCSALGNSPNNGGAEAFVELQKALNVVGDYRLSTSVNTNRWAIPVGNNNVDDLDGEGFRTQYPETDYKMHLRGWSVYGNPDSVEMQKAGMGVVPGYTNANAFCGTQGSCCYASAIDLETSNGIEISGLNAEEQSDIAFIANWAGPQNGLSSTTTFTPEIDIFSYYDCMIVLRENNLLELIQ